MYYISIIGCCATRDVFHSGFVPEYSKNFRVDTFINSSSIPSVMAKPIPYKMERLEQLNEYFFEYHYFELNKTLLATIEAVHSDLLILDFYYDAYYGTYEYDDSYIRGKLGGFKKSGVIDNDKFGRYYNYDSHQKEYYKLWCKSFDRFMDYAGKHFPTTKIIINGIKGTDIVTDPVGNIIRRLHDKVDIERLNEFWSRLEEYCVRKYKLPVIQYEKEYTNDENHPLGNNGSLVHFHKDYYTDAYNKILDYCSSEKFDNPYISGNNLIRNSNFYKNLEGWSLRNCDWIVKKEKETGKQYIMSAGECRGKWKWMWSDPVEIDGNGERTYIVSFDVKVDKPIEEPVTLLAIRVFKHAKEKLNNESLGVWKVVAPVDKLLIGKWMRYSYRFVPKGRFVRIAPHVGVDGVNVKFARFKLECGEQLSEYSTFTGENIPR